METSIILAAFASLATAYTPLSISCLESHQPAGVGSGGQVNYWRLGFNVSSCNSGERSAYCARFWSDNCDPLLCKTSHVWSDYVPANQWVSCFDSEADVVNSAPSDSPFSFEIGNFTLEVRETLENGTSVYGRTYFSNLTMDATLACDINPSSTSVTHAWGDCFIAAGHEPVEVSMSWVDPSI